MPNFQPALSKVSKNWPIRKPREKSNRQEMPANGVSELDQADEPKVRVEEARTELSNYKWG